MNEIPERQGGDLRGRGPVQLDLSTCVNPYGPPGSVVAGLRSMPESAIRLHPYAAADDVEAAYAGYLGRPVAEFAAGRGASEFIWLLARQFDGKLSGLPQPAYTEFRRAFPRARLFGGGPSVHPAEVLEEAMRACDMVIVSNPHNPTGQVVRRDDLAEVASRHPAATLVVDESYMDFLDDQADATLIGCPAENVIVLRSPSKFWGLAGARSGVAWSRRPLRAQWENWRTAWPVSAYAAAALRTALAATSWTTEIRQVLARDAEWLEGWILHTGLDMTPGRLHFRLLTGSSPAVRQLADRLDAAGIAVRVLDQAYGAGIPALRISAPRPEDRWQLAAVLDGSPDSRAVPAGDAPGPQEGRPAQASTQATDAGAGEPVRPGGTGPQAGGTTWSRAVACLCFELSGPAATTLTGWQPGPLPVRLPDGRVADHAARATYFQDRASGSLYGPAPGVPGGRWHRILDGARIIEGSVLGIELLAFPRYITESGAPAGTGHAALDPGRYLCVLHVSLDHDDPAAALAAAVRLNPDDQTCAARRSRYAGLAGSSFRIPRSARRALSVSLLTYRGKLQLPPGAPWPWTPTGSWLWTIASATPLDQFAPDPDDPHALDGLVYLSSSWRALVLRDGIGFLGLTPDTGSDATFFDWGECYVRSLYTDVALLAALERDALDDFANRLAQIGDRFERSAEFRRLVGEVTEFRNLFWWEAVTRHGNANTILEQLHEAHRTPRLFTRVVEDLDAFRQQVETRALEKSFLVQVAEERRSRRFEHAAAIAAIAFAVPALVFAGLTVPVDQVTSGIRDAPAWALLIIGLAALMAGAITGAAGGRWISGRTLDEPRRGRRRARAPARR